MAYPIGGTFHAPRGLSNTLVLPHVLRFNLGSASALCAKRVDIMVPRCGGSYEERALALMAWLKQLIADTGIAWTLHEVGIDEAALDQLATDAMLQPRLLKNNPRPVA